MPSSTQNVGPWLTYVYRIDEIHRVEVEARDEEQTGEENEEDLGELVLQVVAAEFLFMPGVAGNLWKDKKEAQTQEENSPE